MKFRRFIVLAACLPACGSSLPDQTSPPPLFGDDPMIPDAGSQVETSVPLVVDSGHVNDSASSFDVVTDVMTQPTPDAGSPDSSSSLDAGTVDVEVPETGPDVSVPDSGPDVVVIPDSGPDAIVIVPDSGPDVEVVDSGPDVVAVPDAGPDVEVQPDSGPDSAPDAGSSNVSCGGTIPSHTWTFTYNFATQQACATLDTSSGCVSCNLVMNLDRTQCTIETKTPPGGPYGNQLTGWQLEIDPVTNVVYIGFQQGSWTPLCN